MNKVSMQVNGREVRLDVAPRTHLGDFLRDQVRLTGTHLGCEHGVCGACTVLLDGEPVRSCITFAVACEGRRITTVEGYDADPVMALLRPAFTRHHALQCGFCTPGMLATARDIVVRLPQADEPRVRVELAGNLCRCTGYMGIVAAILSVLDDLRREPVEAVEALRKAAREGRATAPAASASAVRYAGFEAGAAQPVTGSASMAAAPSEAAATGTAGTATPGGQAGERTKGSRIDGYFDVPFPVARVWAFMADLPAVAACLPGASIASQEGDRVKGRIAVKFGPMSAAFNGAARLERDEATRSAVLRGAGQDSLSQSRANGDVAYRLEALPGDATRVKVELVYSLQGPLAQFSRSGLVRDFVRRMIDDFGRNVTRRMQNTDQGVATPAEAGFSPLRMFLGVVWDRIRRALGGR
jgi:carbon-monoxide dehydrogenase small subunit